MRQEQICYSWCCWRYCRIKSLLEGSKRFHRRYRMLHRQVAERRVCSRTSFLSVQRYQLADSRYYRTGRWWVEMDWQVDRRDSKLQEVDLFQQQLKRGSLQCSSLVRQNSRVEPKLNGLD